MAYIEKEPLCAWLSNMGVSEYIIKVIENEDRFPTADVEEVRHGYWVDDGFGRGNMLCSVCEMYQAEDENGNPLSALANWEPEICPHCGAKMDGRK